MCARKPQITIWLLRSARWDDTLGRLTKENNKHPVRLVYQPPANNTFLSEQISHHQSADSTFLSEQISISHQPPAKRTGRKDPQAYYAVRIKRGSSLSTIWFYGFRSEK
jgi:hypothetical protein